MKSVLKPVNWRRQTFLGAPPYEFSAFSGDRVLSTMNKSCSRCSKVVYPLEELKCLEKVSRHEDICAGSFIRTIE